MVIHGVGNIILTFYGYFWFLLGVAVFLAPYLLKCGIDMRKAVGSAGVPSRPFQRYCSNFIYDNWPFCYGLIMDADRICQSINPSLRGYTELFGNTLAHTSACAYPKTFKAYLRCFSMYCGHFNAY